MFLVTIVSVWLPRQIMDYTVTCFESTTVTSTNISYRSFILPKSLSPEVSEKSSITAQISFFILLDTVIPVPLTKLSVHCKTTDHVMLVVILYTQWQSFLVQLYFQCWGVCDTQGMFLSGPDGNRQRERQGLWERVHQAKRPSRPSMRVVNLWVKSLRSLELVRTSLRNQTVRHNISSVKSRTDGWRRMVLSSRSGDVTFLLTKMIRGNISLIHQVQNTTLGMRRIPRHKYVTISLVLSFIHTCMKSLEEHGSIKQSWFGLTNPWREFPVSSVHESIKTARLSIHTKSLSFCDDKHFPIGDSTCMDVDVDSVEGWMPTREYSRCPLTQTLSCGGISTCKSSLTWPGCRVSTWLFLSLLCLLRDSSAVWDS